MTIHALDKNYKIEEVTVPYQDRDADNPSKLNTIGDGIKVIKTTVIINKYIQILIRIQILILL